jgi:hypothetical protein
VTTAGVVALTRCGKRCPSSRCKRWCWAGGMGPEPLRDPAAAATAEVTRLCRCLTRCHLASVSSSCHFFRTPLSIPWRHIQSLRDTDQTVRKVPSRDGAIPAAAHA